MKAALFISALACLAGAIGTIFIASDRVSSPVLLGVLVGITAIGAYVFGQLIQAFRDEP